ncbi:MAG TPA: alpha/beta hydrolase, partial [Verrucomicrobiae bacterium]
MTPSPSLLPTLALAGIILTPAIGYSQIAKNESANSKVKIYLDSIEHGKLTVQPAVPPDGQVPMGTVFHLSAHPAPGYRFDAGYYAAPGVFGQMYYESMTPDFTVTADRDKSIGASFIPVNVWQGFKVMQDVVYAKPGVKPLKYDVYIPDHAKNLPCLVIIHGGGWMANNEDIMRGLARELVRSGRYVVCSIDYRWIGRGDGDAKPNTLADILNDVYGALAHIQEHATKYGADATRLAVTGDSAGGHLSAAAIDLADHIGDGGFGVTPGVYQFKPTYLPANKSAAQVGQELTAALKAAAPSYGVFSPANL